MDSHHETPAKVTSIQTSTLPPTSVNTERKRATPTSQDPTQAILKKAYHLFIISMTIMVTTIIKRASGLSVRTQERYT